jgi:hypothetical protein
VPIAQDGGGDMVLLDQRAGREGNVGEHYEEGIMEFGRWPATLTDLLEQTATAVENGKPVQDRLANTENGKLDWALTR